MAKYRQLCRLCSRGWEHSILKGHEQAIREEVESQPDATLEEIAERVAKKERMKVRVSRPTMCRELQRLRLPFKRKSLHADERDSPRVKEARSSYLGKILDWVLERFLFIDEAGVNLTLTRHSAEPARV